MDGDLEKVQASLSGLLHAEADNRSVVDDIADSFPSLLFAVSVRSRGKSDDAYIARIQRTTRRR